MVSWSDVCEWRAEPIDAAEYRIGSAEAAMQANGELLYRAREALTGSGLTVTAAQNALAEAADDTDFVEAQLTDLLVAMGTALGRVSEIERWVQAAQDYAYDELLLIHETGSVHLSERMWDRARSEATEMEEALPPNYGSYNYGGATGKSHPPNVSPESTPTYCRAVQAKELLTDEIAQILELAQETDEALARACELILQARASTAATEISGRVVNPNEFANLLEQMSSASQVRSLWCSLSPQEQQAIKHAYPAVVAETNGIPFVDRRDVNARLAQARLEDIQDEIDSIEEQLAKGDRELRENLNDPFVSEHEKWSRPGELGELKTKQDRLLQEQRYITDVLNDPARGFLLFDPEHNRIIEQNGYLTPNTDEVYTHVPGTTVSPESFYDGSASAFARRVFSEGKVDGTDFATFTYMDGGYEGMGDSIRWGYGERGNANESFLLAEGKELKEFQDAVTLDAMAVGADVNIGGHSAGMSLIFASETHGARYDQVHSLSGSFAPGSDWHPSLATEYDHYYYSPEPLNALERSPFKDPSFERHAYEGGDPMDNHGRTNSGNDDNYDLIVDFIAESRGD